MVWLKQCGHAPENCTLPGEDSQRAKRQNRSLQNLLFDFDFRVGFLAAFEKIRDFQAEVAGIG